MNLRLRLWLKQILVTALLSAMGYLLAGVATYQWRENQAHDALAADLGITKATEASHYAEMKSLESEHHEEDQKRFDRIESKEDRIYDILLGRHR